MKIETSELYGDGKPLHLEIPENVNELLTTALTISDKTGKSIAVFKFVDLTERGDAIFAGKQHGKYREFISINYLSKQVVRTTGGIAELKRALMINENKGVNK